MYERFYGLKEQPFDLTPNPRYLFLTAKHREALTHLQYGMAGRKGITLLIGEAGTGKTTLVHTALEQQRGQNACTVYLSNPLLSRAEFFEFLAWGFGLDAPAAASKTRFLLELTRTLIQRQESGGASALIIDEAQCLSHELLEEIRLLSNIETSVDKLLPVILVGQPELADQLNEPSLRQLKQRVALRCVLPSLDAAETAAYIANRVTVAGGDGERLFAAGAVETIFDRSGGIPRTISVICDNALVYAFATDERPVSRETVLEVCRDFDLRSTALTAPTVAPALPRGVAGAPETRDSTFF
jgi:type II secretory pathway predicted ATPase ExeA